MPLWVRVPAGGTNEGARKDDPCTAERTKKIGKKKDEKKGKEKELVETVDMVVRKGEDEGWKVKGRKPARFSVGWDTEVPRKPVLQEFAGDEEGLQRAGAERGGRGSG